MRGGSSYTTAARAAAPQQAAPSQQEPEQHRRGRVVPLDYYPAAARLRVEVLIFQALPELAAGRRSVRGQPRAKLRIEVLVGSQCVEAALQLVAGRRGMAT